MSAQRKGFPRTRFVEYCSKCRQDTSLLSEKQGSASATAEMKYGSEMKSMEVQQTDPASTWARASNGPYLAPGLLGLSQQPAGGSDPTY